LHSCRKDSTYQDSSEGITDKEVLAAKSWYESTYTANANSSINKLTTLAAGKGFDYSQHTRPDWRHSASYKRFNKNVIEIPIDPATPVLSQLKNNTNNTTYADKENSRSSFLILNDGTNYQAYIMTIIADPAYLKGDRSKLKNNTYNHRDTDFTGMVFYFTPKGQYVSGYAYKNGRRIKPASANAQTANGLKTNSGQLQTTELSCVAWYMGTYVNGELVDAVYMYTICTDDGLDSGGGQPVPPAPVCPPGTTAVNPGSKLQVTDDTGTTGDGLPGDDGSGFPPPDTSTNSACVAPAIIDSVKNPCLKAMVDSIMSKNIKGKIDSMIQGVFGGASTLNLTFTDQKPMLISTDDGEDIPFYDANHNLLADSIHLNAAILATSSKEFIAATIMHEALHAYLDSKGIAIGDMQHNTMATNYLTTMAHDLKSMFPGMTDQVAYSLAWGGLEGTPLYASPGSVPCPGYQSEINTLYRFHTDTTTSPARYFGHGCN